MPNYESNFYNNQTTGMYAKAMRTASKGDPSGFVIYKGKQFPATEAAFFVIFHGKTYAVLTGKDLQKAGKPVGEVRLIREGEKDYSDHGTGEGHPALQVYRRFLQYFIEDEEKEGFMKPICRLR